MAITAEESVFSIWCIYIYTYLLYIYICIYIWYMNTCIIYIYIIYEALLGGSFSYLKWKHIFPHLYGNRPFWERETNLFLFQSDDNYFVVFCLFYVLAGV